MEAAQLTQDGDSFSSSVEDGGKAWRAPSLQQDLATRGGAAGSIIRWVGCSIDTPGVASSKFRNRSLPDAAPRQLSPCARSTPSAYHCPL